MLGRQRHGINMPTSLQPRHDCCLKAFSAQRYSYVLLALCATLLEPCRHVKAGQTFGYLDIFSTTQEFAIMLSPPYTSEQAQAPKSWHTGRVGIEKEETFRILVDLLVPCNTRNKTTAIGWLAVNFSSCALSVVCFENCFWVRMRTKEQR
jgi:hypothetical protein